VGRRIRAPVLEKLFGSTVKLTKDNKMPGSIVGEILDTHERGEILCVPRISSTALTSRVARSVLRA
jgi:hypothetical protein